MITLMPHQEEAVKNLTDGNILYGKVGSGKSFTGLFYYLRNHYQEKLYIITTAKKRDDNEWQKDIREVGNIKDAVVDSWNNISKYTNVADSFFIFDEQRAIGSGTWSKSFIKISQKNKFILLTGTPGDNWMDYVPIFIANGFYKNKTDFINQHVEYDRFAKFPKVKAYHNVPVLIENRNKILTLMVFENNIQKNKLYVKCEYDKYNYEIIAKKRWNPYDQIPIPNVSKYQALLRKATINSYKRIRQLYWIVKSRKKVIVFYNYNYELESIRELLDFIGLYYHEWNGHKHEPIPKTNRWVYLVQYNSGSEGWNCIDTNIIVFYSMNHSYRIMHQSEGRIDRLNTKYKELDYIYFTSDAPIDLMILKAYNLKKKFNIEAWAKAKWEEK